MRGTQGYSAVALERRPHEQSSVLLVAGAIHGCNLGNE
jgi:hypothetical protein